MGQRKPWSREEDEYLHCWYPSTQVEILSGELGRSCSSVYQRARLLGLRRQSNPGHANLRNEMASRFRKGHTPWNKGMKGWNAGGRSRETRFKKGHKPVNTWLPVGTERVTKDGILQRKVSDTGVKRIDWKPVHVLVWESEHGPVPDGHVVVFSDRDRRNFDIQNLECISRAENMRRNSYHRYPQPIPKLIQLRGVLNRQINERARREKQD